MKVDSACTADMSRHVLSSLPTCVKFCLFSTINVGKKYPNANPNEPTAIAMDVAVALFFSLPNSCDF